MSRHFSYLKRIGLKNFKGHEESEVSLAPITLFFGPNSSGKSTFFQMLYLLKQTFQFAPDNVPLLFRCDGGYIDLGSFEDVIFNHDLSREIGIKIDNHEFLFKYTDGKTIISDLKIKEQEHGEGMPMEIQGEIYQPFPPASEEEFYHIVYRDGEHKYLKHSTFYDWAYELIDKNRKEIIWGIEQKCLIELLNSLVTSAQQQQTSYSDGVREIIAIIKSIRALMPDIPSRTKHNPSDFPWVGKRENSKNELRFYEYQLIQYHLGVKFDKRKIVTPEEYEQRQADLDHTEWINPFERGAKERIALTVDSIEDTELRKLMQNLVAKLDVLVSDKTWKSKYDEKLITYESFLNILRYCDSSETFWQAMEIDTEGLGVTMKHCLPERTATFTDRKDRDIENILAYMSLVGPSLDLNSEQFCSQIASGICPLRVRALYSNASGVGNNVAGGLQLADLEETYNRYSGGYIQPESLLQKKDGHYLDSMPMNSSRDRGLFIKWVKTSTSFVRGIYEGNALSNFFLDDFNPVGPIRLEPRRVYWGTGAQPGQVGFRGEWVGEVLLDDDCQNKVNEWMVRLTGYEVLREDVGEALPGAYVLKVRDKRLNRDDAPWVKITDVGFGISQVLPLVDQLVAAKGSLITIEQPESQIHPALQAEFAELVVWSMQENKNQILVETHSEHLLLRLMKLIRQTTEKQLPVGISALTPEDVKVIFVETDNGKSIAREMPLNERGELVKAWPGGFFEEGLREMF